MARLGGDEFVVMLEDLSATCPRRPRPRPRHRRPRHPQRPRPALPAGGPHQCRSTASIGITVFGDQPESVDEILQQADIAMYQAKAAGRNTIRFFAPALQAAVNARAAMEEDLRQAIRANQFVLYYQPQVDRGRLIGAEALIRWNHPRRGLLLPGEFIPLAEETGLILPMGNWVLETACKQIAAWAQREETAHIVGCGQHQRPAVPPAGLCGAGAGRAGPHRGQSAQPQAGTHREHAGGQYRGRHRQDDRTQDPHGLRFSLDDFGTGYSSLAYLKRLPLDQLKIDRSFVRDILVDASSGAIAQTIISLSKAMGLPVIAEGVETEEQRDYPDSSRLPFVPGLPLQPAAAFGGVRADLARLRRVSCPRPRETPPRRRQQIAVTAGASDECGGAAPPLWKNSQ